jgi:hypothetical protein
MGCRSFGFPGVIAVFDLVSIGLYFPVEESKNSDESDAK